MKPISKLVAALALLTWGVAGAQSGTSTTTTTTDSSNAPATTSTTGTTTAPADTSAPPPAVAATPPPPAEVKPKTGPNPFEFALHGFVSGTGFVQEGLTWPAEGQMAISAAGNLNVHRAFLGFDVRQSRLNFSVTGPKLGGVATPKAVVEIDFFNGFGPNSYGNVSLLPRLRLAYGEVSWGGTRIDVGQMYDLTVPMIPVSVAHLAFPVTTTAGEIGWRRPGIWGYHKFGGDTYVELAWMVGRSQWNETGAFAGSTPPSGIGGHTSAIGPNGVSLGEASALPAVQARLSVGSGKEFSAFIAGHWNRVNFNGVGVADDPAKNLDVVAGNIGAKVMAGPLTIAATAFTGKNLAALVAYDLIYQAVPVDIHDYGGWAQAGINFTKELSLWALGGFESPNVNNVIAAHPAIPMVHNTAYGGLLQYREGGLAVGLEWYHYHTMLVNSLLDSNQYMASMNYYF